MALNARDPRLIITIGAMRVKEMDSDQLAADSLQSLTGSITVFSSTFIGSDSLMVWVKTASHSPVRDSPNATACEGPRMSMSVRSAVSVCPMTSEALAPESSWSAPPAISTLIWPAASSALVSTPLSPVT